MQIHTVHEFLNKRPVVHGLFWTFFVVIGSFVFSYQQNFPYLFFLLNFLIHLPVFILFTYLVIYVMVPRYLLNKRYWQFFAALVVATSAAALTRIFIGKYIYYHLFIPEVLHPKVWISTEIFFVNLMWIVGTTTVFAMFKYYKNWMSSQELAREAERKHLSSELQMLKAQLNPHFLFNTLNNLYVLALQKSDKTPVAISLMSDLFHYILYECNAVEVPVSKEVKLIEDYIQLEELRYSDRLSIRFEKEIGNPDCMIPPMLLYTFVENCFKHGCSNDPGNPQIDLKINVQDNRVRFEAINTIPQFSSKSRNGGGVGLANVKKRLELIYPFSHQLKISREPAAFHVRLDIQKT